MRIYLAARYRRQGELRRRAEELSALGHEVTARWIHGFHRAAGGLDDPLWPKIAQEDVDDVAAADAVVCFLESNGGGGGGRHAEFGAEKGRAHTNIEEQIVAAPGIGFVFGSDMDAPRGAPAPAASAGKAGGGRRDEGVEAG